jgi:hypothetical protein
MSIEQGLNRYRGSRVMAEVEKTSFEKIQDKRIGESIRVISIITLNVSVSLLFGMLVNLHGAQKVKQSGSSPTGNREMLVSESKLN